MVLVTERSLSIVATVRSLVKTSSKKTLNYSNQCEGIRKTELRLQITSALYWWEFVTYSVSLWGILGVLGKNITPYEFPCQHWRKALAEQTNRFNLSNRPVYAVSRLLPPDAIRTRELSSWLSATDRSEVLAITSNITGLWKKPSVSTAFFSTTVRKN